MGTTLRRPSRIVKWVTKCCKTQHACRCIPMTWAGCAIPIPCAAARSPGSDPCAARLRFRFVRVRVLLRAAFRCPCAGLPMSGRAPSDVRVVGVRWWGCRPRPTLRLCRLEQPFEPGPVERLFERLRRLRRRSGSGGSGGCCVSQHRRGSGGSGGCCVSQHVKRGEDTA